MKKFICSVVVLLLLSFLAEAQELKWYKPVEGFAKAKKEKKFVLVDFYTEWCSWCKKMDKDTYSQKEVIKALNDNFVCIKYNPETDSNIIVKGKDYTPEQINAFVKVNGYPATVFFTSEADFIQTIGGYREKPEFVEKLLPFILSEKASTVNYNSVEYLEKLAKYEANGITDELLIAKAMIYNEVEGDVEKAVNTLMQIDAGSSLYTASKEIIKYIQNPESGEFSSETKSIVEGIIEKFFKN